MHKHPTWTVILAAALLVALNALALPKMLGAAYAMPEREVVAQQSAETGDREPLPEVPAGIDGYVIRFSREMTDDEQAIWAKAKPPVITEDGLLAYSFSIPRITYSAAAAARYHEAMGKSSRLTTPLMRSEGAENKGSSIYEVAEIGLDLGVVTVFLPDTGLLLKQAMGIRQMLPSSLDGMHKPDYGAIGEAYAELYQDFRAWIGPQDRGSHTMSRGLCPEEQERYEELVNRYVYEGLRAASPLSLERPKDDGLWYDEAERTVRLPEAHQMTDEELLQYYELERTLVDEAEAAQ